MAVENLLQGHLAMELAVQGDERHQAAPGVGPQDAESLAVARGRAERIGGCAIGIVVSLGRIRADIDQRPADVGIANLGKALAGGRAAGMAARLFLASPPCLSMCRAASTSMAARWAALRSRRATRQSASD